MAVEILSISDTEISMLHSPQVLENFASVDLVISCGDLPHSYLEYLVTILNKPLYYVHGNHAGPEYGAYSVTHEPGGGLDLHRRCRRHKSGLLLAGVEGCQRYNNGRYQYSQLEMWGHVLSLVPHLLYNRIRYGRYLDIFASHAASDGIMDEKDLPHQGIKAFRWLVRVFKPALHLHGHIHVYRNDTIISMLEKNTRVINTFGYRRMKVIPGGGNLGVMLLH